MSISPLFSISKDLKDVLITLNLFDISIFVKKIRFTQKKCMQKFCNSFLNFFNLKIKSLLKIEAWLDERFARKFINNDLWPNSHLI
ncbi:hypothetical protein BpHYR1_015065 [Brachionus plicatilis]|uniref:Uncharacterized protein n=1 Tax=Brachionus plicatilis TaxID=10195 RepID=A0A3M7SNI3_BRAPC|nr:hypothetical protein BpHYR1_015065 [Brachionus plicatilis]